MTRSTDYLIEFISQGAYVKVSALDPVSGMEVSIVGAAGATQSDLARLAIRKLEARLFPKQPTLPPPPDRKNGLIV
jgi:hypothetical protein